MLFYAAYFLLRHHLCDTYEASCSDQIDRTLVAGLNCETAFSYFPVHHTFSHAPQRGKEEVLFVYSVGSRIREECTLRKSA